MKQQRSIFDTHTFSCPAFAPCFAFLQFNPKSRICEKFCHSSKANEFLSANIHPPPPNIHTFDFFNCFII